MLSFDPSTYRLLTDLATSVRDQTDILLDVEEAGTDTDGFIRREPIAAPVRYSTLPSHAYPGYDQE